MCPFTNLRSSHLRELQVNLAEEIMSLEFITTCITTPNKTKTLRIWNGKLNASDGIPTLATHLILANLSSSKEGYGVLFVM